MARQGLGNPVNIDRVVVEFGGGTEDGLVFPAGYGKVEGDDTRPCGQFLFELFPQTTHDVREEITRDDVRLAEICLPEIAASDLQAFSSHREEFGLRNGNRVDLEPETVDAVSFPGCTQDAAVAAADVDEKLAGFHGYGIEGLANLHAGRGGVHGPLRDRMDHDDGKRMKNFQRCRPSDDREDDDEPRRHRLPPGLPYPICPLMSKRAPRGQPLRPVV